jgi:4-amino-4-deoxy-L-arabinose transferase-like glycosyltransferase
MHDNTLNPATSISPSLVSARWLLGLLLLITLWFATLGARRLIEPDEGRYAEISREMLVTEDWLTPRLNGIKYFEKPPLQYWATAGAYRLWGQNEFSARFWTGFTGFAGIVLLGFAGRRLFDVRSGLAASAILASSLLYVVVSHFITLDMSLAFFMELAVFSFLLAQRTPPQSPAERYWMWLAWTATALGFLSKGLVALILPALTLLVYSAVTRETSAWKRLHVLTGLPLLLAISAPWVIAVSLRNPEFPQFFFLHEQLDRFLTTIHHRDAPWWYFLPLLVLGALPWSSLCLFSFTSSWRADTGSRFQARRFLWLYIIVVMLFFSVSHSKLPPYIAPAFPAIALLTADAMTRMRAITLHRQFVVMASVLALLTITILLLPDHIAGAKSVDLVIHLRPWTAGALGITALSAALAVSLLKENNRQSPVLVMGFGTLLGMSLLIYGADALRMTRSDQALAAQLLPQLTPEHTLYSIGQYPQTLPFYLGRTLKLVEFRGELDFGLTQEPALGLTDVDAFVHAWVLDAHPIAILRPDVYERLNQQGVRMEIIAKHSDLLAIGKPRSADVGQMALITR